MCVFSALHMIQMAVNAALTVVHNPTQSLKRIKLFFAPTTSKDQAGQ